MELEVLQNAHYIKIFNTFQDNRNLIKNVQTIKNYMKNIFDKNKNLYSINKELLKTYTKQEKCPVPQ